MTAYEEHARPLLTIDLPAVADNTRLFVSRTAGEVMAVVKADGFGHGAVDVARSALASGAASLGVATIQEATALRAAGLPGPLLSWLNPVDAPFEDALRDDVELAVPSAAHLRAVIAAAGRTGLRATVHLHADVGMARDGAPHGTWAGLCKQARAAEECGDIAVRGVMGHLGWADDPSDPFNTAGRQAFVAAVATARRFGLRPSVRHLAATAATLTNPGSHFELCRIGAGLVGIDPSGSTRLRPAMTLTAPVVALRDVPAGTHVGYGHAYVTSRRTRLALLPVGYADGIPRSSSGRGCVLLHGRRCRVVGLVSMDQVVVEVGRLSVSPGEVATVFGPGDGGEPTAADWAGWSGTIEHEIVTGIGPRVARRVVGAHHQARQAVSA